MLFKFVRLKTTEIHLFEKEEICSWRPDGSIDTNKEIYNGCSECIHTCCIECEHVSASVLVLSLNKYENFEPFWLINSLMKFFRPGVEIIKQVQPVTFFFRIPHQELSDSARPWWGRTCCAGWWCGAWSCSKTCCKVHWTIIWRTLQSVRSQTWKKLFSFRDPNF